MVSKPIGEEADYYFEHPEFEHRTIDEVAYEDEETGSSEGRDEGDGSGDKEVVQIFYEDIKEESAQQPGEEGQPPEEQPRQAITEAEVHVVRRNQC